MPGTHSIKFVRASNQRAEISNALQTGLDLGPTFSLEAWLKLTTLVGTDDIYAICGKYDSGTNNRGYWWRLYETGDVSYRTASTVSGDGTSSTLDGAYVAPGGLDPRAGWHHYAMTYNQSLSMPTSFVFYLDGQVVETPTILFDHGPTAVYNNVAAFQVGANSYFGSNYSANMQMDELRVWNVVRSQAQIQGLMGSQAVGTESGLVLCCHFDNDFLDATANNNDLTGVNSPTFVAGDVGGVEQNAHSFDILAGEFGAPLCDDGSGGGVSPGDPPDITVGSPAAGSVLSQSTPLVFDVTEATLLRVVVSLVQGSRLIEEIVHDGTVFSSTFTGPTNTRVGITDGYRYTLLRDGGWKGSPTIRVKAVAFGVETTREITWTL